MYKALIEVLGSLPSETVCNMLYSPTLTGIYLATVTLFTRLSAAAFFNFVLCVFWWRRLFQGKRLFEAVLFDIFLSYAALNRGGA